MPERKITEAENLRKRTSSLKRVFIFGLVFLAAPYCLPAAPQISEDRDLKELDLASWNCLNKLEGSARTPDSMERNRLKNRSAVDLSRVNIEQVDIPGFLKLVGPFDAQTKGKRRKDLNPEERKQLDLLEKKIVQVTGYLALAYVGPPETTNCASMDFHDWHLEITQDPPDHPPQVGDPTPIICEITPRTQNAIFHDNIRIQELAAFFRRTDLTFESTGHKAGRIRLTGYLMWDDEHNGSADIGETIKKAAIGKFHNPWRSTAWEIHPVLKIEPVDGVHLLPPPAGGPASSASTPPQPGAATPAQSPFEARFIPAPGATPPQFTTITQPVKIKIPYGETILPRGATVPILGHDAKTVTVKYMGGTYIVPITSTDLP